MLFFRSEARETLGSETARGHLACRRRGYCVAARGVRRRIGKAALNVFASRRDRSPFFIFALKRFVQNLVDFRVGGISRVAVIAGGNRDRNAAMNITFVAPLPKSDLFLAYDDVSFPTNQTNSRFCGCHGRIRSRSRDQCPSGELLPICLGAV
jgi:hypothetical protein